MVVDADEENTIGREKLIRELEAGVHDREPERMPAPLRFEVASSHIAGRVNLTGYAKIGIQRCRVVVAVEQFATAGTVVRRVDIDEFDGVVITPVQQLQNLQVLALDQHMGRGVEML